MKKITSREFAKAMHEALEEGGWGDIDPVWFQIIAEDAQKEDPDSDMYMDDDIRTSWELENVISEVIDKLNSEE